MGRVVNVALPALQAGLQATISQVQWVVESYALFLSALMVTGGALGDLYGQRQIFTLGNILFAAGSAACGLSPNISLLIAVRAIQGIGDALLVPGGLLALISELLPPAARGRAIESWSGFTSITAAVGPVLGGWLVPHGSWRWPFFINLPIVILVLLITGKIPRGASENRARNLDWVGASLTTIGLAGVVYASIESQPLAVALGSLGVDPVSFRRSPLARIVLVR